MGFQVVCPQLKKSSPLGCVRPLMFFSQLSANLNILLDLWYPVTEFFRKECESKESADPVADKVAALYSEKRFHLLSIFGLVTRYGSIDLDRTSISSMSRLFPVRDTHQRTLRYRFSGACQLRCKQITQFRIVMSAEPAKFCACVKPTCFYHFREGSHTRANFHMRSMGIYRRFSLSKAQ